MTAPGPRPAAPATPTVSTAPATPSILSRAPMSRGRLDTALKILLASPHFDHDEWTAARLLYKGHCATGRMRHVQRVKLLVRLFKRFRTRVRPALAEAARASLANSEVVASWTALCGAVKDAHTLSRAIQRGARAAYDALYKQMQEGIYVPFALAGIAVASRVHVVANAVERTAAEVYNVVAQGLANQGVSVDVRRLGSGKGLSVPLVMPDDVTAQLEAAELIDRAPIDDAVLGTMDLDDLDASAMASAPLPSSSRVSSPPSPPRATPAAARQPPPPPPTNLDLPSFFGAPSTPSPATSVSNKASHKTQARSAASALAPAEPSPRPAKKAKKTPSKSAKAAERDEIDELFGF
ncbi:hypothetical protein AMAG_17011 [Allomyces macrogynus ATCC 38327]|uniref:Nucleolus and neural progenitor protein-like N-terminal domain-containing protein n=1 Tax=Allomyces macrogynus (strain ATCC 38327) TaxID=578462 RepID=A0A0L0TDE0_ALLM3|nr:hypothetical protein AMAG_17011 [Allomyces macrogynus ATCC 38327]|eukprot:KNE72569.1 hypothetical protein AMAG_17011 [Allomyces macrogynus ATCC 38327]